MLHLVQGQLVVAQQATAFRFRHLDICLVDDLIKVLEP